MQVVSAQHLKTLVVRQLSKILVASAFLYLAFALASFWGGIYAHLNICYNYYPIVYLLVNSSTLRLERKVIWVV